MNSLSKKILTLGLIIVAVSAIFNFVAPTNTFAVDGFVGDCSRNFLGLTSWDCGVAVRSEADLKGSIWTIVVNVTTDLIIIAAYLVLGFVIYGGYLYMFSAGDPSKVANGRKTLVHAFVGLAIVMSAFIIMGAIRVALVGGSGDISNCASGTCVSPNQMIVNMIQWVVGIAGVVAVVFIIYGGISYTTSAGDPSKLQKAKQVILYALIGLAIVALAEIITAFVSSTIRDAGVSTINQTTISKEVHEINTY